MGFCIIENAIESNFAYDAQGVLGRLVHAQYTDTLVVCRTKGVAFMFLRKLGQNKMEGSVDEIFKLLENGGDMKLIDFVCSKVRRDAMGEPPVGWLVGSMR